MKQALITHLNCILSCFNSYNFPIYINRKEPKRKEPILPKEYKLFLGENQEVSFDINQVHNANPLNDYEIANILHDIISSYDKNFYYMFIDNMVYKIEIEVNVEHEKETKVITKEVVNKVTEYKLLNDERAPSIVDNKTGLRISIGRQIKTLFQIKDDEIKMLVNTYESFCGTHERIIKALSFEPTACHWCCPDKNKINEKIKCDNCRNLLEELNFFASKISEEIKTPNFNNLITSISINDVTNLAELREKRRKLLYSFLKETKKYAKDKSSIERLKMLINKAFSDFVKI